MDNGPLAMIMDSDNLEMDNRNFLCAINILRNL